MKQFSSIFNVIAIGFLFIMLITLNLQIIADRKDFNMIRLQTALDYATEGAFINAFESGDVGLTYEDLKHTKLSTSNCLDTFSTILCMNYDMIPNEEAKEYVNSFISAGVLAEIDGYYVLTYQDVDEAGSNINSESIGRQLVWSLKKPYYLEINVKSGSESIKRNSLVHLKLISEECTYLGTDEQNELIQYDADTYTELTDILNDNKIKILNTKLDDDTKLRAVNSNISKDLSLAIKEKSKDTEYNYDIYLPGSQTANGINAIDSPSLLIVMQGAEFAGIGHLNEANLEGLHIIKRSRVICFYDKEDKKYKYCYDTQITDDDKENIIIETYANTIEKASEIFYNNHYYKPDLQRLTREMDNSIVN